MASRSLLVALALATTGCFTWPAPRERDTRDAAPSTDAASPIDAAMSIDGGVDGGAIDAGQDASSSDASAMDTDPVDARRDTGLSAMRSDGGGIHRDAGVDTGSADAGMCCVAGHVMTCTCDASTASCSAVFTPCGDGTCYVGGGGCTT